MTDSKKQEDSAKQEAPPPPGELVPPPPEPQVSVWPRPVPPRFARRSYTILGVVTVVAAALGFLRGTEKASKRAPIAVQPSGKEAAPAQTYRQLRDSIRGKSGVIYAGAFERFQQNLPGYGEPIDDSPEARAAAVTRRAERRAYAGAPPTIPHDFQQTKASACLACHDKGAKVANLRAPAMSHRSYEMCTQCHAGSREQNESVPAQREAFLTNEFVGVAHAGPGERASETAAPVMPHSAFMRENCSSCHGLAGEPGLRTTHPERANCRQCHAADAAFDQDRPPAAF